MFIIKVICCLRFEINLWKVFLIIFNFLVFFVVVIIMYFILFELVLLLINYRGIILVYFIGVFIIENVMILFVLIFFC